MNKNLEYVYEFSTEELGIIKPQNNKDNSYYSMNPLNDYRKESKEKAEELGINDHEKQDAFRHTWTSADVTYKHGGGVAKVLGDANENLNPNNDEKSKNQDLWNNDKGREIGEGAKKAKIPREKLPELVKQSMDRGDLITDRKNDKRVYKDKQKNEKKKYVIWVSNGGCDACNALDGQKFEPGEVPGAPHPNCKCTTMEIYE